MLRQEGVDTFRKFCSGSSDMSSKDFAKLCRDCGLIGKTLLGADVDLIFTGVVPKGQRRIELQQFETALRHVAEKRGVPVGEVCLAVEESPGPRLNGTKADVVRFHDDRSTYTGTHRHVRNGIRAGTTTSIPENGERWQAGRNDLENSVPPADKPTGHAMVMSGLSSPISVGGAGSDSTLGSFGEGSGINSCGSPASGQSPLNRRLTESVAHEASRSRRRRSESPTRARRRSASSHIPGGSLGSISVGVRRGVVDSPQQRGKTDGSERGVPSIGIASAASGVPNHGGSIFPGGMPHADSMASREPRTSTCSTTTAASVASTGTANAAVSSARAESPPALTTKIRPVRQPGDEVAVEYYPSLERWGFAIHQTFQAYCGTQSGMDGKSFLKLCKDCNLIDRFFPASEVDLIFVRVRPKGQRLIDLRWFHHALWHVAERRGVHVDVICYAVASLSGPTLVSTRVDPVRFHDDRTTYTGTHVHGGPEVGPALTGSRPGGVGTLWEALLNPEAEVDLRSKAQGYPRPQIREAGRIRDIATGATSKCRPGRVTPPPSTVTTARKQPYPPWAEQRPVLPGTTIGAPAGLPRKLR